MELNLEPGASMAQIDSAALAPMPPALNLSASSLRHLQRHLPQALQDWAEAQHEFQPGSVQHAQALDRAFHWGHAGYSCEVLALALEAVNARLSRGE